MIKPQLIYLISMTFQAQQQNLFLMDDFHHFLSFLGFPASAINM